MIRAKRGEAFAFMEAALASNTDECIIWPLALSPNGYAVTGACGSSKQVHRLVCEKAYGPCPTGFEAAHSCNVRKCINPKHVTWKTRKENAEDRQKHGTQCAGETHGQAKLTWEEIFQIRTLAGTKSQRALATQFKVAQVTIHRVINDKNWKI